MCGCSDPIEDPTVMWTGDFIKIATLTFARGQTVNNYWQQEYCRSMAFNPWNGIVDHKPLGNINRQR